MDPIANPFAPGAGSPPPELAGRDKFIQDAKVTIQRAKKGRPSRSFIFVGLRGVGKTVLLNEVQAIAEKQGVIVDLIEANDSTPLAVALVPTLKSALLKLDRIKGITAGVKFGMRVLKSFVSAAKVKYGEIEFSMDLDAEEGTADSGDLSRDLRELFVAVGKAAKSRQTAIVILIDEVQYLKKDEFSALIMAVHRVNQENLPLVIIGAGLPQLLGISGDTKSYAERLFEFPDVGPLTDLEAKRAIEEPIISEGSKIQKTAVAEIVNRTKGYPYFIQEWGYQTWNTAKKTPITLRDVKTASTTVQERLDKNFFKVRFDRLTPSQENYLRAMAELGPGPHQSGEIATILKTKTQNIAPTRDALIKKGMIYSPSYGYTAFTVPLFDEFMKRKIPLNVRTKKSRK